MISRKRSPTHPGGILKRHYLEPLSLTVSQAAGALGVSRKTVSKIVNERGDVTPEMALRLSRALGTTPELWMNLQKNYDLWHASHDSKGWLRARLIPSSSHRMAAVSLCLLLALAASAAERPRELKPLPASPFSEGRVLIDEDAPPVELEDTPLKPSNVRRQARGRLTSVDAKARKLVIGMEDEEDLSVSVPDGAKLTFMNDERPLHLEQLRRGDRVEFELRGSKVVRLHLETAPPNRNARRRPPPPPEEEPDMTPDTEDRPMYMSEPPPEKK